jgi:uncharacterized tellurite resistance protein B-like protein
MALIAPPGFQDAAAHELLAMLELMYLVANADGFFSMEERREFLKSVESLSEGKLGSEQLVQLVDSWSKRSPGPDLEKRLAELAAALPDAISRRIAYGLALQIADADGQFLESEAAILQKIAQAFGLEAGDPEDIAVSVRMSRGPKPPG